VLFSPGSVLRLPLDLKQTVKPRSESAARMLADADREHILETLEQTDWLIGGRDGAANRLGSPRTTLVYKMRKPTTAGSVPVATETDSNVTLIEVTLSKKK
jgi:formate hydrogenlyase transcriptional activator